METAVKKYIIHCFDVEWCDTKTNKMQSNCRFHFSKKKKTKNSPHSSRRLQLQRNENWPIRRLQKRPVSSKISRRTQDFLYFASFSQTKEPFFPNINEQCIRANKFSYFASDLFFAGSCFIAVGRFTLKFSPLSLYRCILYVLGW